ncbi:sulfotransferase [Magnetococcales bacterium HHB-1]
MRCNHPPMNELLQQARRYQQTGALKDALQITTHQLERHRPSIYALHGLLLCQRGEYKQGEAYLERAGAEYNTLDAETLADLGGGYILLKQIDKAETLLKRARQINPDLAIVLARLGIVFLHQRLYDAAQKILAQAQKQLPDTMAVHSNRVRALIGLERFDEALDVLNQMALRFSPPTSWQQLTQLELLLILKRFDEAEHKAQSWYQTHPKKHRTAYMLAFVLAARGQHAQADHILRRAIALHPEDIPLRLMRIDICQLCGLFGEALLMIHEGLKQTPDHVHFWIRLAHLSWLRLDSHIARHAAEKALALTTDRENNERVQIFNILADIEGGEGNQKQAESYYRQALDQIPDSVSSKSGLGHLYMQYGRMEEAIALFKEIAVHAPIWGQRALIHVRQFPDDPKQLEQMEEVARQPSLEGPIRSGLFFSLALAWEHKKDYARAFQCALEANQAVKTWLSYSAEAHRQTIESLMRFFSTPFFQQRTHFGHISRKPIFVVGMPRSGTTLVEQILASHSRIFGAGELGLISSFIRHLNHWEMKVGSGLHYPECLDDMTSEEAYRFAEQLLTKLNKFSPESDFIVDKLPHNFEHIGLIHLLFPKATIIYCAREPRDVAISNYFTDYQARFGGMGFAYDLTTLGQQLADHHRLMAHWQQVLPSRIYTVHYEQLVEKPEQEARRLLAHVDVDWQEEVLQFSSLNRPIKTASVWQVRQPIYKTSRHRWHYYAAFLQPLEEALAEPLPSINNISRCSPPPGLFLQGMSLLKQEQWSEAEQLFRQLLRYIPKHAAAHHMLGVVLFNQGKTRWALERIRRSLDLHSGHPSWYHNLAKVYTALGRHQEAEKATAHAIDKKQRIQQSVSWLYD